MNTGKLDSIIDQQRKWIAKFFCHTGILVR